ncbi:TonB-dependent receptor domain-containing protein [Colwellia piezophila]|uniref:TonB-dependent receptor domain-containing protein n=1 Tax=Colwellia piezophila TaxID=211668 RepID=UPI00146B596B|nr:TonB-dependent receptor [Colwellia piezophila]
MPTFAFSAEVVNENLDNEVERISVTGSRIKHTDASGVGKVDSITAEDFAEIGAVSLASVLKFSPFTAGASAGAESNYLSAEGYGTASVNLRGLGQNRTLVLVNGRRFVAGGAGANSVVDLNSIPVNMIERMETLLDGSSAVYGADAVTGVVNIITKRSFDGVKIDAQYGITQENDGKNTDLSLTFGKELDDKGFIFSASYMDKGGVISSDRKGTACYKIEVDGDIVCGGSSYTLGGSGSYANDGGSGRYQFNQISGGDDNSFVDYDSQEHGFNSQSYFYAAAPYSRINLGFNGYFDLTNDITLFTENTYTKRESNTIASPTGFTSESHIGATNDPDDYNGFIFGSDYWANPTGEDINLRYRFVQEGARPWSQDVDLYRSVIGLEGMLDNDWDWSVAFNYGQSDSNELWGNNLNQTKLKNTVLGDCTAATDDELTCVDWFGVDGPSQAVFDYLKEDVTTEGSNTQINVAAHLSGDLMELPAGTLAFAAGVEYLKNEGDFTSFADGKVRGARSGQHFEGSLDSTEVFGELSIPVIDTVTVNLAGRFSDYSQFDSEFTYKVGADWRATDELRIRSTVSTAVRTPNIRELFAAQDTASTSYIDICENWGESTNENVKINCAADNVPSDYIQGDTKFTSTLVGGNPELNPEKAENFTLGFVYQPSFVDNLQISVDYYNIDIKGAIGTISATLAVDNCYKSDNKSDPSCEGLIRSSTDFTVSELVNTTINAASEEMIGIDFGVNYQFEAFNANFDLDWDTAYLDEYNVTLNGATNTTSFAGYVTGGESGAGSYNKIRSNISLTMRKDDWSATYNLNYISDSDVQDHAADALVTSIDAYTYHHISASYTVSEQLGIYAGINNLFDKQAPYYSSNIDQNTDPFTYDLIGRRFFVKASYTF